MSAVAILGRLKAAGLDARPQGGNVVVSPRDLLNDELLEVIRANKAAILKELAAETAEARKARRSATTNADPLPLDFRAALACGRLHVCCNCQQFKFAPDPGGLGHCGHFDVEAWPFVPFWCSGFAPDKTPVLPALAPDRHCA